MRAVSPPLLQKARIQVWLFEQPNTRVEGRLLVRALPDSKSLLDSLLSVYLSVCLSVYLVYIGFNTRCLSVLYILGLTCARAHMRLSLISKHAGRDERARLSVSVSTPRI